MRDSQLLFFLSSLLFSEKCCVFCYNMAGIMGRVVRFPAKIQLFTGKNTGFSEASLGGPKVPFGGLEQMRPSGNLTASWLFSCLDEHVDQTSARDSVTCLLSLKKPMYICSDHVDAYVVPYQESRNRYYEALDCGYFE